MLINVNDSDPADPNENENDSKDSLTSYSLRQIMGVFGPYAGILLDKYPSLAEEGITSQHLRGNNELLNWTLLNCFYP